MDIRLFQLSKHEMQQIEWLILARGDTRDRPYLSGLMVTGDRLVCVDGFRAHSIFAPRSILEDKTLNGKVLHIATAIDSTQDVCAVGFRVGDGDGDTIPPEVNRLQAKESDQSYSFSINPGFLVDALQSAHGMVRVRLYDDSEIKGAQKLAFECDGRRVLIMCGYVPHEDRKETVKIAGGLEATNEATN